MRTKKDHKLTSYSSYSLIFQLHIHKPISSNKPTHDKIHLYISRGHLPTFSSQTHTHFSVCFWRAWPRETPRDRGLHRPFCCPPPPVVHSELQAAYVFFYWLAREFPPQVCYTGLDHPHRTLKLTRESPRWGENEPRGGHKRFVTIEMSERWKNQ